VPSTYDGYRASTTSFGVSHSSERLNSSNSDGTSPESRQYSANQKLGIIKAHLVDGLSIEYLCDRYKIRADEYTQWQQRLFTNGQGAFDADPGKDSEQDAREETDSESEVRQLKKKLAARNELITRQLQDRENDKNEEWVICRWTLSTGATHDVKSIKHPASNS
jgi:transposase